MYKKSCPFATRPVKELHVAKEHQLQSWFVIHIRDLPTGFLRYLLIRIKLYYKLIPLPKSKYEQLQELKRFVSKDFYSYYENLPQAKEGRNKSDDEFDVSSNVKLSELF